MAFEIPLEAGESLIQRHPPKRFTRLEDNQLTLEIFQGKHAGAAERRNQVRISARGGTTGDPLMVIKKHANFD